MSGLARGDGVLHLRVQGPTLARRDWPAEMIAEKCDIL